MIKFKNLYQEILKRNVLRSSTLKNNNGQNVCTNNCMIKFKNLYQEILKRNVLRSSTLKNNNGQNVCTNLNLTAKYIHV